MLNIRFYLKEGQRKNIALTFAIITANWHLMESLTASHLTRVKLGNCHSNYETSTHNTFSSKNMQLPQNTCQEINHSFKNLVIVTRNCLLYKVFQRTSIHMLEKTLIYNTSFVEHNMAYARNAGASSLSNLFFKSGPKLQNKHEQA